MDAAAVNREDLESGTEHNQGILRLYRHLAKELVHTRGSSYYLELLMNFLVVICLSLTMSRVYGNYSCQRGKIFQKFG